MQSLKVRDHKALKQLNISQSADKDVRKLQEYEIGLLHGAWFYIKLHFCRRGREGQCELRPDSFVVMHDDQDHPYLTMTHVEVSKNQQVE